MFGWRGANTAMHRVVACRISRAFRRRVRATDVLETAGEEQTSHDGAQRFLAIGVELVATVQPRLRQECEILAFIFEQCHIERLVGHRHEAQWPGLDFDRLQAVRTTFLVFDRTNIGGLLHAADVGEHIGTLHLSPPAIGPDIPAMHLAGCIRTPTPLPHAHERHAG